MARDFSKNLANYASMPVGTLATLLSGAAKVAVSAWVQADTIDASSNNNRILSGPINAASSGLILALNSAGTLRVGARSTTADAFQTKDTISTLATGTTRQVGGIVDFAGATITPYLDGASSGAGSVTFGASSYTPGTPTGNDMIGADSAPPSSTANQFDGRVEHMAIWVGTSGASSFAAAMASLATGDTTPDQISVSGWTLVLYHPLNDGRPDRVTSLATAATVLTFAGSIPPTHYTLIAPEPTGDVLQLSDSFTGTASTSIGGRSADATGGAWTLASYKTGGATDLQLDGSGGLRGVFSTTGTAYAYQSSGQTSNILWFEADVTMLTSDGDVRFYARLLTSAATGIVIRSSVASSQWQIGTVSGGTQTTLVSSSQTFTNGANYKIRGEIGHRTLRLYVAGKLVAEAQLNSKAFIGQYGHFGLGISRTTAGAQGPTEGWTINSVKVRRSTPTSAVIGRGTNGGNSGAAYNCFHIPMMARTKNYVIVAVEARLGTGQDRDPIDLACWRIPTADFDSGAFAGTLEAYTPVVIRNDGTTSGVNNHTPVMIVDPDGTTVRIVHFAYASSAVFDTPAVGIGADSAQVFRIVSTDEGATWGSPTNITSSVKLSTEVRVTVGPGGPIRLSGGRWAVNFASGTSTSGLGDRVPRILYTDDYGVTWYRGAASGLAGNVEAAIAARWSDTAKVIQNIRDHSVGAHTHLQAYYSDANTLTSTETISDLYQPTDVADGMFHSLHRGWKASEYVAIHANSSARERLTFRKSAVDSANAFDLPVDTTPRVLPGRMFDDGLAAYSNSLRYGPDTLLVATTGGEAVGLGGVDYLQKLTLWAAPRAWLGLSAVAASLTSGTLSAGSIGPTTFALSWTAPTGGVGPYTYQVQRSANGSTGWANAGPATAATSQTIGSLTPSTDQYLRVIATDDNFDSVTSNTVNGTTTASSTPALSPTSATLNRGATQQLTASNFTGGAVTWASNQTGRVTVNSSGLCTAVGVGAATITATGVSNNSETATATITGNAVTLSVSPTTATIVGTATQQLTPTVGGAVNTGVTYSSGTPGAATVNSSGLVTGVAPGSTTITVTSAADGTVTATSAITVTASALAAGTVTPGSPTSTTVPLTWTAPTGGTAPYAYQPQYSLTGSGSWTNIGSSTTSTSATATGLASATLHYFRVVQTDAASGSVNTSNATATTASAPIALAAGSLAAGSPTSSSVPLTWAVATGGTGPYSYQPQKSTDGGTNWANVGSAGTGVSATATGLASSTAHSFRVVVTDAASGTANSNTVNATTAAPGSGATAYTLTGPSTGTAGVTSQSFVVTPNGTYTGTVTIDLTGTLTTSVVLTFSGSGPLTFTVTPTEDGVLTLTPSNSGGLDNPATLTYTTGGSDTGGEGGEMTEQSIAAAVVAALANVLLRADLRAIYGDTGAAINLIGNIGREVGTLKLSEGTVLASPSPGTTTFSASGDGLTAPSGGYRGAKLIFQSGANDGSPRIVVSHAIVGSRHDFVLADDNPLPTAPVAGDSFKLG